MSFNTILLVSIFLVLPMIDKCVSLNIPTNVTTTEEPEPEEEDRILQAANDIPNDYEVNAVEKRATEAPEMDPGAELVDENGRKETDDSKKTKSSDKKIGNIIRIDSINPMPVLKAKFANLIKEDTKSICLNYTQDSGFWCSDEAIGKLIQRYFYQKDTQTCQCFLYYGCLGNKNNFNTLKECKIKCKSYGYNEKIKSSDTNCQIVP